VDITTEVTRMSAVALRAYIRTLRDLRGITQKQVAQAIGLPYRTYVDWEGGSTAELRGSPLVRAIDFLKGSWDDVRQLVREDVTEAQGRQLATDVLTQEEREGLKQLASSIPDDQVAEVLDRIKQLRSDPAALTRLNSEIAALLAEQFERDYHEANKPSRSWLLPRRSKKPSR
jgi:transcriptional regulator with XRE-family HTH domain